MAKDKVYKVINKLLEAKESSQYTKCKLFPSLDVV